MEQNQSPTMMPGMGSVSDPMTPGSPGTAGSPSTGGQAGDQSQNPGNVDDPGNPDVGGPDPAMETDGLGADGRITQDCQGFPLTGLEYSPGGSQLPNKCAPFHPFTNNPYAVRCIEAMPDFATPYAGDEYCILPPPPDKGFQVGVHPQGHAQYWQKMWAGDYSDYHDAAKTAAYELPAGGEIVQDYTSGAAATAGTSAA